MQSFIRAGLLVAMASALLACGEGGGGAGEDCSNGAACECAEGSPGTQVCRDDGAIAACICAPQSSCDLPSEEHCDGLDNDCNGAVDDRGVCPDATITNASPFTKAVYFHGSHDVCNDSLTRFWPTLAPSGLRGFECRADAFRFRRSDGALFYRTTFEGIYQYVEGPDVPVSTAPCETFFRIPFDFDAAGTFHYQCNYTVRRGAGELLVDRARLVATFDDGRILAMREEPNGGEVLTVVDAAGVERARFSPSSELVGTLSLAEESAYVDGNRAYVVYLRSFSPRKREVVIYRIDESSTFARVRRVPVPHFGEQLLGLSDGTVFVEGHNLGSPDAQLVVFRPDGTSEVLLREQPDNPLGLSFGGELTVGPQ